MPYELDPEQIADLRRDFAKKNDGPCTLHDADITWIVNLNYKKHGSFESDYAAVLVAMTEKQAEKAATS